MSKLFYDQEREILDVAAAQIDSYRRQLRNIPTPLRVGREKEIAESTRRLEEASQRHEEIAKSVEARAQKGLETFRALSAPREPTVAETGTGLAGPLQGDIPIPQPVATADMLSPDWHQRVEPLTPEPSEPPKPREEIPGIWGDIIRAHGAALFHGREMIPTSWQGATEAGKAVPGGAVSATGTGVKGVTLGRELSLNEVEAQSVAGLYDRLRQTPGMSASELADLRRSIRRDRGLPPAARIRAMELIPKIYDQTLTPDDAIARIDNEVNRPVEERDLYQAGEWLQQLGAGMFPAAPGWEDSFARKLGAGVGSTIPFLAAGAVGGWAGLALGTMGGALVASGEATERAVEAGASPEEIRAAAIKGLPVGTTEMIPIEILFERIPLPHWGSAMRVLGMAAIEGGQEAAAELAQNWIQRGYDPDQPLLEGTGEAAAVGGSVGATLESLKQIGRGLLPGRSVDQAETSIPGDGAEGPREGVGPWQYGARPQDPAPPPEPPPAPPLQIEGPPPQARLEPPRIITPPPQKPYEEMTDQERVDAVMERLGRINLGRVREPSLEAEARDQEPVALLEPPRIITPPPVKAFEDMTPQEQVDAAMERLARINVDRLRRRPRQEGDGSREAPVAIEAPEDAAAAAERVAEPTEAQKEAGNHRKGHAKFQGLDVTIETPEGGTRTGTAPDGTEWSVQMPAHYGYIKRTEGADGGQVDVYLGDQPQSEQVFVIDQVDPDSRQFDEHKVILGTPDQASAEGLYEAGLADGRGRDRMGAITPMGVEEFREWLKNGDQSAPVGQIEQQTEVEDGGQEGGQPVRGALEEGQEPGQVPVEETGQEAAPAGGVLQADEGQVAQATVPADDAAETVDMSMSTEGPWDFNDTYPAPDPELLEGLNREGRSPFDGPEPSVEEVSGIMEEGLNELQVIQNERNILQDQRRAVEEGTAAKPPKRGMKKEEWLKQIDDAIGERNRSEEDALAAHRDLFGEDAAEAMRAEAEARVGRQPRRQAEETARRATALVEDPVEASPETAPDGTPDTPVTAQTAEPAADQTSVQAAPAQEPEAATVPDDAAPEAQGELFQAAPDDDHFQTGRPRRHGIPRAATLISPFSKDTEIKAHADYKAAKGGDLPAATRLARDLLDSETIQKVRDAFDADTIFLPIHAIEASGRNKIPVAAANVMANEVGGSVSYDVIQANQAFHTGARPLDRLLSRPVFDGNVAQGGRYVIVDDVTVMGGTIAELASYIQENGGEVVGIAPLVNAGRESIFPATPARIKKIGERYGDEIRSVLGVEPAALTENEASVILNYRDADTLRTSLAKAGNERRRRLAAKGISERPADQGGRGERSDLDFNLGGEPYRLTNEAAGRIDDVAATVDKVVSRLAPGTKSRIEKRAAYQGRYSHTLNTIFITFSAADPERTARHEVIHALRGTGLLSDSEFGILREEARNRGWRKTYQIDQRYFAQYADRFRDQHILQEVLDEEAIAEAFARYQGGERFGSAVDRIFRSIQQFVERIRNALSGAGFQSAEDIFRRIESGEVGRRDQDANETLDDDIRYRLGDDLLKGFRGANPFQNASIQNPFDEHFNQDGSLTRLRSLQNKFQDAFAAVKGVQRAVAGAAELPDRMDAYLKEELYHRRVQNHVETLRDDILEPLFERMADAQVSEETLELYLYARHAEERNAHIATVNARFPDGGSGMKTAEAKRILAEFDKAGLTAKLKPLAALVDQANDLRLKMMVDNGLISNEAADALKDRWSHYVPLKGLDVNDRDWAESIGMGRGFAVGSSGIKEALGRASMAKGILANVIADYRRIAVGAEKNRVMRAFYDFAKEFPDTDYYQADPVKMKRVLVKRKGYMMGQEVDVPDAVFGEGAKAIDAYVKDPLSFLDRQTLPVMIDGTRHLIRINNPALYQALGMTHTAPDVHALRVVTGILARLYTQYNPNFVIPNFVRDVQAAGLVLTAEEGPEMARKVVMNSFRAMGGIYSVEFGRGEGEWADAYRELAEVGGLTGWSQVIRDVDSIQDEIEVMMRTAAGEATPKDKLKLLGHNADRFAEKANAVFENAVRVSTYKAMRDAGHSKERAASAAKTITINFNRRGTNRTMGALYLFFNASLQGNVRMAEALVKGKHGPKIVAGLIGVGATMAGLNMILGSMHEEDEENLYTHIPDHVRENNWLFVNPLGREAGVDGRFLSYVAMPQPYGFSFFTNIGRRAVEYAGTQYAPEEFNPTGKSAVSLAIDTMLATGMHSFESFSPIGSHPNPVAAATPTVVKPFAELYLNERFTGDKIIPPSYDPTEPQWRRYYPSTPEFWRDAARMMSDLTGGDAVVPGRLDVSPESLEHLWRSYTGGLGSFLTNTYDVTLNPTGPTWGPRRFRLQDAPIMRRFMGSETSFEYGNTYFDLSDRMRRFEDARRRARRGEKEAREWVQDAHYERRMHGFWKATQKRLKALRDQRNKLERGNLSAHEKSRRIEQIGHLRSVQYRRFVRVSSLTQQRLSIENSDRSPQEKTVLLADLNERQQRIMKILATMEKEIRQGIPGGNRPARVDIGSIRRLADQLPQ